MSDFKCLKERDTARRDCEALQAQVDALMLEFCPEDMTPEQIARWGRHQERVSRLPLKVGTVGDKTQ